MAARPRTGPQGGVAVISCLADSLRGNGLPPFLFFASWECDYVRNSILIDLFAPPTASWISIRNLARFNWFSTRNQMQKSRVSWPHSSNRHIGSVLTRPPLPRMDSKWVHGCKCGPISRSIAILHGGRGLMNVNLVGRGASFVAASIALFIELLNPTCNFRLEPISHVW